MLVVETIAKIRRAYFAQNKPRQVRWQCGDARIRLAVATRGAR
jgi:hypothetical protein